MLKLALEMYQQKMKDQWKNQCAMAWVDSENIEHVYFAYTKNLLAVCTQVWYLHACFTTMFIIVQLSYCVQ